MAEDDEDTGIVYWSRFYRLLREAPESDGPIGADLGYLKFAVFPGDNGTFSVTLATLDRRRGHCGRSPRPPTSTPPPGRWRPIAPWLAPGVSEPITGVHPMARLRNRIRRFLVAGRPAALGVVAVGDAHTCTNPLYGRGCSLAMVQAELLADALAEHPTADEALHLAYEAASAREVEPWYRAAVQQDRMQRAEAAQLLTGEAPDGGPSAGDDGDEDPAAVSRRFMRSVLREGLLPAMRTDPAVFRAFLRGFNLLEPPEALLQDAEVVATVMDAYQRRDERPPDAPFGPEREGLLALLAAA